MHDGHDLTFSRPIRKTSRTFGAAARAGLLCLGVSKKLQSSSSKSPVLQMFALLRGVLSLSLSLSLSAAVARRSPRQPALLHWKHRLLPSAAADAGPAPGAE